MIDNISFVHSSSDPSTSYNIVATQFSQDASIIAYWIHQIVAVEVQRQGDMVTTEI